MKSKKTKCMILFIATMAIIFSCSGGDMKTDKVTYNVLKNVPDAAWENLSKKKIYFGHQSVGYDILHGIEEIIKENPGIDLKIKEAYRSDEFENGTISHSRIGYNSDPESKLKAFDFYMNAGGAKSLNIALFKYCYVDFNKNTNINKIFQDYTETLKNLKTKFPDTIFIVSTVPLTTIQAGYKATIKRIMGKKLGGVEGNIKRNEFNDKLRNEYGDKQPFFDIAKVESTYPDGTRSTFEDGGNIYHSMVPEYTTDGGHLNSVGGKKVAEQFLLLLANL
ncbi:MAG: hypothetical protein CSA21_01620 [Deltaproteobacteria bacterium]|nr:MAG: hypothetical protein CSA21_01620 [Deltaproteobacteria bacterium]